MRNKFKKLFHFRYNLDLPILLKLNELKLTINELKLELYKISNKLITQNNDNEYIEIN